MGRKLHNGRTELRMAGLKRLRDAQALLSSGPAHSQGAMYLAGYAIECKLKAIAMEVYDCWTLDELARKWRVETRDVYDHRLERLAKRLPLYGRFQESEVWRLFAGVVNRWQPSWRYSPADRPRADAEGFLGAVWSVWEWLGSNN